jgi:hypothetical protein
MLHGSGCFTGHVSRFLEKSPPGRRGLPARKQRTLNVKQHIYQILVVNQGLAL